MTRRVWLPLAALVAGLFAAGVWAAGLVRGVGDRLADAINGGKR